MYTYIYVHIDNPQSCMSCCVCCCCARRWEALYFCSDGTCHQWVLQQHKSEVLCFFEIICAYIYHAVIHVFLVCCCCCAHWGEVLYCCQILCACTLTYICTYVHIYIHQCLIACAIAALFDERTSPQWAQQQHTQQDTSEYILIVYT